MLWLGVGLAVGALVVRQVTKAVQAYSPSGIAQTAANSAAGLWESVQDFSGRAQQWVGEFVADVREGMAEREEQIRAAFVHGDNLADLPDEYDFAYDDSEFGDTGYGDTGYGDNGYGDNDQRAR